MTTYIALLRAVNVGGTGALPMAELRAMCEANGFAQVRTYIASGNVVFETAASEKTIKDRLGRSLADRAGKPVGVLVRTAAEMAEILAANPFAHRDPTRTVAVFLDRAPPKDVLTEVRGRADEEIALGRRELYVHYPQGQGRSKLVIAAAAAGTARNMNTVAKLAEMAAGR